MPANMSKSNYFRVIDIFVIVFFLSTAIWGIYLFREDLMRTLEMRDAEPAGFIQIRDNIVQRRHGDRVLWDRLYTDSKVYSGDLIRAADLSSALINVSDNEIFLSENTLIRIQHDASGRGQLRIELREGRVGITGSQEEDSQEVFLEIMGQTVQAGQGAVLDAEIVEDVVAIQVSEGTALFVRDQEIRSIVQGETVALDTSGVEVETPLMSFNLPPRQHYRRYEPEGRALPGSESTSESALETPPVVQPKREIEVDGVIRSTANYTVAPGDTLGRIARQVYGDATQWRRIFEANNISNPDLIFPGQVFIIP